MSLLEEWKQNYLILEAYSEEIFGLKDQPEDQCPKIDSLIRDVEDSISSSQKADYWLSREDYGEVSNYVFNAENALYSSVDELENLREEIIRIRAWGQDWKDLAKKFIDSGKIDINEYVTEYYRVEE